jgi:hypothetical protein
MLTKVLTVALSPNSTLSCFSLTLACKESDDDDMVFFRVTVASQAPVFFLHDDLCVRTATRLPSLSKARMVIKTSLGHLDHRILESSVRRGDGETSKAKYISHFLEGLGFFACTPKRIKQTTTLHPP